MRFEKAIFVLDAFEDEQFEGYTRGETWNGFACPYFPFESAQHLMNVLSAVGQVAFYDEENDQFVCAEEDYQDDPDRYEAVMVKELGKLYPVGSFAWTWEKMQPANAVS